MVLVSGAQLVNREVIEIVINSIVGKVKVVIKIAGSTAINGDGQLNFVGGPALSLSNSTKKNEQFVVRRGVVQITVEVTDIVVERGFDEAVANFHG